MYAIGFDNNKYVSLQSERIRRRIGELGGKLYLEFGGKLFDDYHASRVLPGFRPDSKIRMLLEMKDEAEIIVVISADDVERNKRRGDLGITYDMEALRLIDAFRASGLYVGGVCITHCREGSAASPFEKRLASLGLPVYRQYLIPNYPADLPLIVSPEGFGKSDFIETTRPLVVVTGSCNYNQDPDLTYFTDSTDLLINAPIRYPVTAETKYVLRSGDGEEELTREEFIATAQDYMDRDNGPALIVSVRNGTAVQMMITS